MADGLLTNVSKQFWIEKGTTSTGPFDTFKEASASQLFEDDDTDSWTGFNEYWFRVMPLEFL